MNTIDRVVYINLDHRTDRRDLMESQFSHMGLIATRFPGIYHSNGALGCTLSHAEVMSQAIKDNVNSLLIIEDDMEFTVNRDELDNALRLAIKKVPDFDVLLLDYNLIRGNPIDDGLGRVEESQVAGMYLVAGHYLPTLYKNFMESYILFSATHNERGFSCDQYWKRLQARDRWYYLVPRVAHQRSGYSDICKRHVTHDYYLNDKQVVSVGLQGGLDTLS